MVTPADDTNRQIAEWLGYEKVNLENALSTSGRRQPAMADPRQINYDVPATAAELEMLFNHDWEVSDDERYARLYSEEYVCAQTAVYSTQCWIEENRHA